MLNIKKLSAVLIMFVTSSFSLSAIAADYYIHPEGTKSIASISSSTGKKLSGLVLEPGQSIKIRCVGNLRQTCNIGQFVIKTDYKSASECQKSNGGNSASCAKFDNNWRIAKIYSDHGNTGVLVGPLSIRGEYTYRIINLGQRKLYFIPKNSFNG